MLKHYVEFFFPGIIFSESKVQEVKSRDCAMELPEGAYGYLFFSQEEVITPDGEVLKGDTKDFSVMTYFGEALTLEQVKALQPADKYRILASNMECNGYGRVVRTIRGNFQPLRDEDIVISP